MERPSSPDLTGVPKQPPPSPIAKKTSPTIPQTMILPTLRSDLVQMGQILEEKDEQISWRASVCEGWAVALQRMPIEDQLWCQDSWTALYHCRSPFWLPVIGTCEYSKERLLVMAALPETSWSSFLSSSVADVWSTRCQVVRDVAVGLYQRRAAGVIHIGWDTRHLNLDAQGRAQLFPLLRKIPAPESDDVLALGQLLWQMASRSTVLVDSWEQGKGLPHDCPPAVVTLIQVCANSVVSARPSLKALAKGLDTFWQRAVSELPDATPAQPLVKSQTEKEKKYDSPHPSSVSEEVALTSKISPFVNSSLATFTPLTQTSTPIAQAPKPPLSSPEIHPLSSTPSPADEKSTSKHLVSPPPFLPPATTLHSQTLGDTALSSGVLSVLLIDDQTVSWLTYIDPRYQVGLKLCALRDSLDSSVESKTSLSRLQQTIQATLLKSNIEMLLWLGENGEDPGAQLTETAGRLWQTPEWQSYRPGDPPPTTWLPLLINLRQPGIRSPLFTHTHQPLAGAIANFTEDEWQVLQSHYALFWLVQGMERLTQRCNLYEVNALYRAAGYARLLLHSSISGAFKREESTDFMPHDDSGRLLPMRYSRYVTNPAYDLSVWGGRYLGRIGQEMQASALNTSPLPMTLVPEKSLALNRQVLVLPTPEEEAKQTLGKGAFGEVLRGTYYGQAVAVKRFKEAKLSVSDQAQLRDEAAVMANLQSSFLIGMLGLSLETPPLLVMELAQGGSLYNILKDPTQTLSWSQRLRLLRDIVLGLAALHAHDLVHRDLKSLNILLDAEGRAKLCDFGLSTLKSQAKETSEVGTRLWNAPEVLQGKAATPASDIYSFAMVCWEVATRRVPYQTLSWKNEVAQRVQQGQREIIPGDCPPELAVVIQACWEQDPNQRPTACQVAQVLEGLWQAALIAEQGAQPSLVRQPSLESKRLSLSMPPEPLLPTRSKTTTSSFHTSKDYPSLITVGTPIKLFSTQTASREQKGSRLTLSAQPSIPQVSTSSSVAEFKTLLAQSSVPSWQDKQSPQYTLGVKLVRLRQAVLIDPYITQELSCYIAPNGQAQGGVGQPSKPLYPWIEQEWLHGDAQVLLLQGLAGAGKSAFNRHLLRTLWQAPAWQAYRSGDPAPTAPLPLFIPLQSPQVNPNDLWDYYHHLPEIGGFTSAEIQFLQRDYRMIWIADGYDEIPGQRAPNLFDVNHLGDTHGQVKLIIGCRSQRVQTLNEADSFMPHTPIGIPESACYRTRHVSPFTKEQTQDYIEKFVAQHQHDPDRPKDWGPVRYQQVFAAFSELQTLIDTPFMLWLTLSILPNLVSEQAVRQKDSQLRDKDEKEETKKKEPQDIVTMQLTRAILYDKFMDSWFTRQAKKAWHQRSYLQNPAGILGKSKVQTIKQQAADAQEDVQIHLLKHAYGEFCLTFAQHLFQTDQASLSLQSIKEAIKKSNININTLSIADGILLLLLSSDTMRDFARLRLGCPLRESSDHAWSFMHASLFDYFIATSLAKQLLLTEEPLKKEISVVFRRSFAQAGKLLARKHLTPDQVHFLADWTKTNPRLRVMLLKIIEHSKTNNRLAIASANAITVLNATRYVFADLDFAGIRIPGADLTGSYWDQVDLRGADLSGVDLRFTWMHQCQLQGAVLQKVQLGEFPSVLLETTVRTIVMHPRDPQIMAIAAGKDIVIYDRVAYRVIRTLHGHTKWIRRTTQSGIGGPHQ